MSFAATRPSPHTISAQANKTDQKFTVQRNETKGVSTSSVADASLTKNGPNGKQHQAERSEQLYNMYSQLRHWDFGAEVDGED